MISWFKKLFGIKPEPVLLPLIAVELDYEWLISHFDGFTYTWNSLLAPLHEFYSEVSYEQLEIIFKVLGDLGYKYEDKKGEDSYTPDERFGELWHQISELVEA